MAKTKLGKVIKKIATKVTSRPKPNTITPGLSKGRRYNNGGTLKVQGKKKSI